MSVKLGPVAEWGVPHWYGGSEDSGALEQTLPLTTTPPEAWVAILRDEYDGQREGPISLDVSERTLVFRYPESKAQPYLERLKGCLQRTNARYAALPPSRPATPRQTECLALAKTILLGL